MYKVLVVDDEADVREGVLQEMEWQTHGFEVAGIAENGKEAQELAERLRPDLIVTDIKMPFLDGLQLAAWCKETMPAVRIIILTGFDEFDYAQRALKLHIDEYVLKPFSAGELLEAMLKVKVRLDEERAQKETMQQLQEAYQKSLPILRDAFLSSLVSRVYAEEEVLQKAGHYGLNLQAEAYVVAVACVDHPPEGEWELSLFAVQKIAAELLEKSMRTFSFLYHDSVVLLFCVDCGYEEAAWQPIMSNLADICLNIEKFYRFTITIGVGTFAANPARLRDSYQAAVQALDYRAIVGMNRVICINDVEQRKGDRIQFDEHMEQELVRCLKVGTHTELLKLIDELFGQCAQARVSIKEFQLFLLELLTTIGKTSRGHGIEADQLLGEHLKRIASIHQFHDLEETKQWITGICAKVMKQIAQGRQTGCKQLVEQAISFIQQHYDEPGLTIQKVCQHLHISAGYFSSIFKKETKTTFGSYLLSCRMGGAQELLRTTDWKTAVIAEKVGYTDPNYFSFCFRKHTGMSPKEYRQQAGEPQG